MAPQIRLLALVVGRSRLHHAPGPAVPLGRAESWCQPRRAWAAGGKGFAIDEAHGMGAVVLPILVGEHIGADAILARQYWSLGRDRLDRSGGLARRHSGSSFGCHRASSGDCPTINCSHGTAQCDLAVGSLVWRPVPSRFLDQRETHEAEFAPGEPGSGGTESNRLISGRLAGSGLSLYGGR